MDALPLTFASGWASGINAYATVVILGLLGRFAGVDGIPEGFQRTDVLVVMGVLALVEFVADKIPYLDSAWDAISTLVRPVVGALIGGLIGGATGDLATIALASVGGVTALLSHTAKAGVRLAINTSPEPVTNIGASLLGDIGVLTVVTLAVAYPVQAAVIAGIALALTITVAILLISRIRVGWRAFRRWLDKSPT